jgi:imidazole glycerol-phosphate synthase subunit HisH
VKRVGIIDYGSGNFGSVWNAVSSITTDIVCVTAPEDVRKCSHIILPGVGAFAAAMRKIENMKIKDELLLVIAENEIQFLGICVGMQVLATLGREFEECAGLDLMKGTVEKISVDTRELPLPHIGWNSLINPDDSPLFDYMEEEPTFYFVHSYHFICEDPGIKPVYCEYGIRVTAAVSKANIHGVQFHPEKSQNNGIELLRNFISF